MIDELETNDKQERPAFLTVLCVLSFIASGISIVGMLVIGAAKKVANDSGSDLLEQARQSNPELYDTPEKEVAMQQLEVILTWPYIIVATILILVSLFGVIKMWKLKKQGFFIYTAAAIGGLILPLLYGIAFSTLGLIIPVFFIVMYGVNLKAMK